MSSTIAAPGVEERAKALDAFLRSRRSVGMWAGIAAGLLGSIVGWHMGGVPLLWSILGNVVFFAGLGRGLRRVWIEPDRVSGRGMLRVTGLILAASYAGALASLFGVHRASRAPFTIDALLRALWDATSLQLGIGLAAIAMLWAAAAASRAESQRTLEQLKLQQERDAASRQAAEARLHLLQAQIQPHFLFNTLAALQHWVDSGDARAGALLRTMTAFLRGSTELLGRTEVSLDEEAQMVSHYLGVMQARLGARLRFQIDIAEDCKAQMLPPGLLITLVENAVEHGIEPALHGGCVSVRARREEGVFVLQVIDDGAGLAAGWHEGVGLANSRERVAHAFGARASLELHPRTPESGVCATLRLGAA